MMHVCVFPGIIKVDKITKISFHFDLRLTFLVFFSHQPICLPGSWNVEYPEPPKDDVIDNAVITGWGRTDGEKITRELFSILRVDRQ